MSLPGNYVGIAGDRCSCGRRATIRHCPSCGSFKVKLRPSARTEVKYSDKLTLFIDKFICVRCGFVFDDNDRESCEAPLYQTRTEKLIIEAVKVKGLTGNLSLHERRVLDSIDPLTNRYRLENPLNRHAPQPNPEPPPPEQVDKNLIRRFEIEYATMCLRTGERASDEGRQLYIKERIAEIRQMEAMQHEGSSDNKTGT